MWRLTDRTYAVGICREVWRDTQRVPGPSIIASFWPVSATNVAETGQKGEISGAVVTPPNPHRVSPVSEGIRSGTFPSFVILFSLCERKKNNSRSYTVGRFGGQSPPKNPFLFLPTCGGSAATGG